MYNLAVQYLSWRALARPNLSRLLRKGETMAFISAPCGVLTINLEDESGTPGKTQLHFPTTALVADVKTAATNLIPILANITDCKIHGYSITYAVQETLPTNAIDGARVENKGVFIFTLANTLSSRMEVPGIKEAILTPEGAINVEDTAVVNFLAAIIDDPAIFRGLDGSDIVTVSAAYQRFRRSTKAMLPTNRKVFNG